MLKWIDPIPWILGEDPLEHATGSILIALPEQHLAQIGPGGLPQGWVRIAGVIDQAGQECLGLAGSAGLIGTDSNDEAVAGRGDDSELGIRLSRLSGLLSRNA
jgi:hypothetical protein